MRIEWTVVVRGSGHQQTYSENALKTIKSINEKYILLKFITLVSRLFGSATQKSNKKFNEMNGAIVWRVCRVQSE